MRARVNVASMLALTLLPALALAHPGHANDAGFFAGFAHPWTGIDHIVTMLAAGLWLGRTHPRVVPALSGVTVIGIVCGASLSSGQIAFTVGFIVAMLMLQLIGAALGAALSRRPVRLTRS